MKKIEKMQGCSTGELCDKVDELVDAVNLFFTSKNVGVKKEPLTCRHCGLLHDPYSSCPKITNVKEEPQKEEINQCDGCRRGIPIKDGVHQGNSVWDLQACTKDKYKPTLAERLFKTWKVCDDGEHDWSKTLGECLSDEAKKAFEELINESVVLEILRNELISKIRRM